MRCETESTCITGGAARCETESTCITGGAARCETVYHRRSCKVCQSQLAITGAT